MTTNELTEILDQKRISGHLKNVLIKLKKDGLVEQTIPDKSNLPSQRLKLTESGKLF